MWLFRELGSKIQFPDMAYICDFKRKHLYPPSRFFYLVEIIPKLLVSNWIMWYLEASIRWQYNSLHDVLIWKILQILYSTNVKWNIHNIWMHFVKGKMSRLERKFSEYTNSACRRSRFYPWHSCTLRGTVEQQAWSRHWASAGVTLKQADMKHL